MPRIGCPSCGAVVDLRTVARTADEFCPTPGCDYPLFWARVKPGQVDDGEAPAGAVVRRRPGTGGRDVLTAEPCPVCREPNRPAAVFCHRCGADMHPAPAPPPAPAAPPPPEPVPSPPPPEVVKRRSPWADWRVIAVLVVLLVMLMLTGSLVLLSRA